MRHVPYKDFSGGLDLRDQVFSDNRTRFRLLSNFYVSTGKKLVRRPPLLQDGNFDAQTQGVIKLNGQLYTFAPIGSTIVHTGAAANLVKTLYFHVPDYCTTWQFVHARVFNGVVIAYIRHTFPGNVVTSRLFLHVFDGSTTKPTYVEDPYCPTSWGPSLPLHAYGQGTPGSFQDYDPFIGIGATRAWAPRPDGNVQYSKLGNARQWNTRAQADVLGVGELYYFIIPKGGPTFNFIVSSKWADLAPDRQWSAYVLEYLDSTGTWQKFMEDSATPTLPGHYYPAPVGSRFTGQPSEIQLQVFPVTGADTIIRFRLIAGPAPVQIASGCTLSPSAIVTSPNGVQYQFPTEINYQEFLDDWEVQIDGVVQEAGTYYTVSQLSNGNAQVNFAYDSLIPAQSNWNTALVWALNPYIQVYTGGVLMSRGNYTIVNNGGYCQIVITGSIDTAVPLQAIYIPPANCLLQFNTTSTVVISAGVINFEGNTIAVDAQSLILDPSSFYQLSITVPGSGLPQVTELTSDTQQSPGNGYQRYFTLATYIVETDQLATPDIESSTPYLYGSNAQQPSAWYNAKNVSYLLNDVGVAEAGTINSASYVTNGGTVLAMSQLQARMAFHFAGASLLFAIDQSQANIAYLDSLPFGVVDGGTPQPVSYYDGALIPTPTGPRILFLFGVNSQSMQDTNVGMPIQRLGVMQQASAVFWPWLGLYIAAGTIGSQFVIECLSYSKEGEITAWSTWSCAGLSSVDPYSFIDIDSKLYLRSGTTLCHFDALPTICQDDLDVTPYESRGELHYDAFGDPSVQKMIMGVAFSMNGTVSLLQALLPYSPGRELQLCQASGVTYGFTRIPLRSRGVGIATIISCTDPNLYPDDNGNPQPFTLDQFGLDVKELRPQSRR